MRQPQARLTKGHNAISCGALILLISLLGLIFTDYRLNVIYASKEQKSRIEKCAFFTEIQMFYINCLVMRGSRKLFTGGGAGFQLCQNIFFS